MKNNEKVHAVVGNRVRELRQDRMMSKAELARRADVTVQTIDRIEKGKDCRLDTKRKIILALGYELGERSRIFNSTEEDEREPRDLSLL